MLKKSQSAMEFLMTYGWALLLVLVVVGTLAFFGILNPDRFLPDKVDVGPEITIVDSSVSEDVIQLLIKNTAGSTLRDLQLNVTQCDSGAGTWSDPVTIQPGDTQLIEVYCETGQTQGSTFRSDVKVNYTLRKESVVLGHSKQGELSHSVRTGITCNDNSTEPIYICNCEQLEGIESSGLSYRYIQAVDIDCSDTVNWDSGAGFNPIGAENAEFNGSYDGQGYTITGLYIMRNSEDRVGLFADIYTDAEVTANLTNIHLVNINISGRQYTGGIVGHGRYGNYSSLSVSGTINSTSSYVGGLAGGSRYASIHNSFSTANIRANALSGGLIGWGDYAIIYDSYATGTINVTTNTAGGLVGDGDTIILNNSYATGNVYGGRDLGGLIGYSSRASINHSYATGNVIGTSSDIGGLAGEGNYINIQNSYATGNVWGDDYVAGLVGNADYAIINDSYATGTVTASDDFSGGLIGDGSYATVTQSYATGDVTGDIDLGGLAGIGTYGSYENTFATGSVSGRRAIGGLIGRLDRGNISNSYATGAANGSERVGGLVGEMEERGWMQNVFSTGVVNGSSPDGYQGGLLGLNDSATTNPSSGLYWYNNTLGNSTRCVGNNAHTECDVTNEQNPSYFYDSSNQPLASWDFTEIWQENNNGYPTLR